jgi:DNA mismatch repair protein MutS2
VEAVSAVEEELKSLESEIPKVKPRESPTAPQVSEAIEEEGIARPIREGDTVWVRPLNSKGEVLKVEDGDAEVQVGRARTHVSLSALELRKAEKSEPVPEGVQVTTAAPTSPGRSIDLRGATVNESLDQLDRYLDQAMRAGLPEARIIHGKGTGTLRRAVRDFLGDHPLVRDYEGGDYREGGEGVTVARIVKR